MSDLLLDYVRLMEHRALTLPTDDPLRLAAVQSLAAMVMLLDDEPSQTPDERPVVVPFSMLEARVKRAA